MPSLHEVPRKRGPARWRLHYRLDGKQYGLYFADEQSGQEWLGVFTQLGPERGLELLAHEAPTEPSAPEVPTVRAVVEEHIASRRVEPGTRDQYLREAARDIYPHLGHLPITALGAARGPDLIAGWVNTLIAQPLAGKTISNRHGLLSAALGRAVRQGLIPSNPCADSHLPESIREDTVILDDASWWRLRDAMREHWRPLLDVLVGTGLRWSEATALQVGDVDLGDRRISVKRAWKFHQQYSQRKLGPPKSKAGRRQVPFGDAVAAALKPLVENRGRGEFVFTNTAGGVIKYSTFHGGPWTAALDRAGLDPRPSPHDLRHTYASRRLASGKVTIFTLSQVMGHESITITTQQYGHLIPGALDAVAEAGEFVRPPSP